MKTKNIILYLMGLFTVCSCQDMFEPADENNRQEDAMYEESKYAAGLLMYGYSRLPYITSRPERQRHTRQRVFRRRVL